MINCNVHLSCKMFLSKILQNSFIDVPWCMLNPHHILTISNEIQSHFIMSIQFCIQLIAAFLAFYYFFISWTANFMTLAYDSHRIIREQNLFTFSFFKCMLNKCCGQLLAWNFPFPNNLYQWEPCVAGIYYFLLTNQPNLLRRTFFVCVVDPKSPQWASISHRLLFSKSSTRLDPSSFAAGLHAIWATWLWLLSPFLYYISYSVSTLIVCFLMYPCEKHHFSLKDCMFCICGGSLLIF